MALNYEHANRRRFLASPAVRSGAASAAGSGAVGRNEAALWSRLRHTIPALLLGGLRVGEAGWLHWLAGWVGAVQGVGRGPTLTLGGRAGGWVGATMGG